jgi:hypothetical protein
MPRFQGEVAGAEKEFMLPMFSFEKNLPLSTLQVHFKPWKTGLKQAPSKRTMHHTKIFIPHGLFQ